MRELQDIQNDINQDVYAIENAGSGVDTSAWEAEKERYEKEYEEAKIYWENQKTLEERVEEEVRDNGYIFDTLKTSDGLTMPEIILDDVQYDYVRRTVQHLVVGLNTTHSTLIETLLREHRQEAQVLSELIAEATNETLKLQAENKELEVKNYELGLENDELSEKVRKVAELQHESNQQIAQQKQHIEDLRAQQTLGIRQALNVVSEPQDTTSFKAEIDASKKRITNVQFKDEHGIDRRTKTAIEVLTGEPIEYQEYVEKRYIILSAEQAEQYRADEANKKAEAEQQQAAIPTLEVPEIQPVNNVTETDEAAEIQPFQEEVQATDSGTDQTADRNESVEQMVEQESQVVTRAEFEALKAEVGEIKASANRWAA